ncbi:MAG: SGNH/GDSL hydrolase family protein [Fastidiosipilaceae bacterium]|jgi:lysophospholipase L1-like esterase
MKYVLCYGDSNTRGASPDDSPRYDFDVRWPGVLQRELPDQIHVYENGLGGRTTTFTDDVEPGRNGRLALEPVLDVSCPLDLVILMLGTNDCKDRFSNHSAWDVAEGMRLLVKLARNTRWGKDQERMPRVLVVSPAKLGDDLRRSSLNMLFSKSSAKKSAELAELYERVATEEGVDFLDAARLVDTGKDSVHLDAAAHQTLGEAMAEQVRRILAL